MGGDTDSNACIVGGMVGCIVGIRRGLPVKMLNKVLKFDCTTSGHIRDQLFSVKKHGVHLCQ